MVLLPIGTSARRGRSLLPIGSTRPLVSVLLPIGIMDSDPQDFGQRIRRRRLELGISQQALADVVGVNRRVVGELERGKSSVQLGIALRAAEALGLDIILHERNR